MKSILHLLVTFSLITVLFSLMSIIVFPWVLLPASIVTGCLIIKQGEENK